MAGFTSENKELMAMAVKQAQKARYSVSPRPWVGCVISAGSEIHTGFTQPGQGAHAEIDALKQRAFANPSQMYVTLEPCAHKGKTAECSKAIIASGIPEVFIGIKDPDPKVNGRGIAELEAAGIKVRTGLLADEISQQLKPYLIHRTQNRPYVVLKLAATLDGRIAAADGSSKWITGEPARADAHRLRAESDTIIIGKTTLKKDNPALTIRDFTPPEGVKIVEPLRVVFTSQKNASLKNALKNASPEMLPKMSPEASPEISPENNYSASPFLELSGTAEEVLQELYQKDNMQVLIEGGSKIAHTFHKAQLIDKYVFYFAPRLFASDLAKPMFSSYQNAGEKSPDGLLEDMSKIWDGKIDSVKMLGADLRIEMSAAASVPAG